MAAGVVPQSSCSFNPITPALICSCSAGGKLALPLPKKAQVHSKAIRGLQHALNISWAGCAGGGGRAGGRASASAQHGSDAAGKCFVNLLRANKLNVRVNTTCGDDHPFAVNDFCAGANDDVRAGLHFRIACFSCGRDTLKGRYRP